MGVVRVALPLCLFLALLRGSFATNATKCFACVHADFPSGVPNIYNNEYCKDYTLLRTVTYAGEDCPNDGRDYVCAKVDGYYTFDVPSVGISVVDSTIRRCVVRPGSFESTNQGICVNTQALDESTNDINLIGASSDVGDITKFTGQICYCNGDNCNSATTIGHQAFLVAFLIAVLATLAIRHF
ncbi:uncharacterized protein LOC117301271 [Asterias rubens]|uniref:uncharacterized protein LOC117301271 n=1 Tax=Asterias rubens TaxID=7604 RepID=UPI0014558F75|nr:uncharacterized protein LOC117301271 [Asterias rubens]